MNRRIIIENRSYASDEEAVACVLEVISAGRISNDGRQYCYLTTFKSPNVAVSTDLNKCSDRFVVLDNKSGQLEYAKHGLVLESNK